MRAFNRKRKPKHTTKLRYSKYKIPYVFIGYSKSSKRHIIHRDLVGYLFPRYWYNTEHIISFSSLGNRNTVR